MRRVAIVGCSCSGKTTLARRLAAVMRCPHVELDSLHWGPNWTERPRDQTRATVDQLTQQESWVTCGNYAFLRDILWSRADTLVWLNYSIAVIWFRALRRTIGRSVFRRKLWNGNRESLRRSFFSRDSILLWVLQTLHHHRRENPHLFAQPEWQHLRIVCFRRPSEADRLLRDLTTGRSDPAAGVSFDNSSNLPV